MFINGNQNTLLWYIVFGIQWVLSITCFILLLQISYYSFSDGDMREIEITGEPSEENEAYGINSSKEVKRIQFLITSDK